MIKDYDAEYRQIKYDTKKDYEIVRGFEKIINQTYQAIETDMREWLPNLKISIAPDGFISLWAKTRHGEAIKTPQPYNVGQLLVHQVQFLLWANKEVEKIISEPDKYFWCTECGKVHPIEDYQGSVFAGYWCKDCYNNNKDIQEAIRQSNEPGFYD